MLELVVFPTGKWQLAAVPADCHQPRPPSHGKLMLWGIDELLTYHYLVQLTCIVWFLNVLNVVSKWSSARDPFGK